MMPVLPTPLPPAMRPPMQGEKPVIRLPEQSGLQDVAGWLMRLIPILFPGLYPGWTWWTTQSGA
jgi:hypothetical protein